MNKNEMKIPLNAKPCRKCRECELYKIDECYGLVKWNLYMCRDLKKLLL
ncbi:MAG: hypothetical protein PWQ67_2518 [Clostridia bacterium]|nr:hypothetical protein [Clostridia bacterium]